ncbi:hypothetical protein [Nesterenkonia cremea]|uniref:Uncharacterized protein n=1 Tax=Nesterenkonia cremea TaxID=1882340 RepID=A0A917AUZ2_9MICC|nr:hypothetical protein [Nesterenkonia cremea]GGE76508.1 hypothetical protein GCM10011401_24830 [Nesterenkonia cremea]
MGMRELRIHGVGGSTGAELLGLDDRAETILIRGDRSTQLIARREDPSVEGYLWGGLTSVSALQPLWVLLLPFTLVNVAGWTHGARIARWRWMLIRGLVHLAAGLLTSTYVLWTAIIAVDYLGYQALRDADLPVSPAIGVLAGLAVTLALVVVLLRVAEVGRRRFEARTPDGTVVPEEETSADWHPEEDLSSRSFFSHGRSMTWLLRWHAAVLGVTGVVVLAVAGLRWGGTTLGLGEVFLAIGLLQMLVIVLLAGLTWRGGGQPVGTPAPRALPAAAVTLAVALTNGVFSGVTLLAARAAGLGQERWGQELALIESFVITVALWAILVIGWLLFWRARGRADELPEHVEDQLRRRTAAWRGTALGAHRAPVLLVWLAGTFLLSAGIAAALRFEPDGGVRWLTPPEDGFLADVAMVLLPGLALAGVGVVWLSMRRRVLRRTVAIIWDVLTFWPRRFHPLAVRPYSSRAVLEFQAGIRHGIQEDGGVVVSAYSQGSAIAYAALAPLPQEEISRVCLLSIGAPTTTLYAQVFPAYFGELSLQRTHDRLASGAGGWRNLYRRTDPIGGPVLGTAEGHAEVDQEVPDPAEEAGSVPEGELEVPLEAPREPWADLAGHVDYHREQAYRDAVAEFRRRFS